ncbi:MAG: cadherin domain-containing protein, partial [Cyanobacteriota bacterium]|nr:cadherin domain-containing protein [Cyanobacteriota bacterium]
MTVTVQDLNDETPAFTSSGTPSINENVRNVLTLAASDTDAGDSATFAITGGADSELFEIDGGTTLRFAAAAGANYESPGDAGTNNEYVVVVTATDTGANAVAQTITITIQDVNEFSPVFGDADGDGESSTATATPNENQQAVGTYAATDADGSATQTYSILTAEQNAASVDHDLFSVAGGGVLTFQASPNYEDPGCGAGDDSNTCAVVIQVTDGANTDTITVTVNVQDVGLDITSGQSATLSEGANNGDAIMTVSVTGDTGGGVFLTINGGNSDGIFAIANNGDMTVADNTNLDYDTTASYTLTLVASDLNNQFDLQTVVINIQDINDETPVFTSSATPAINENVRNVVTLASTDADSGDSVTYSITGGADQGLFEINGGTTLRFQAAGGADYENPGDAGENNNYVVQVTASDGADPANTAVQTISITVNAVNDETPTFTSSGTPSINENVRNVLTLAASDDDAGDSVTFAITGGADSELFEIDGGTTLRFAAAAGANYESPGDAGTNN